MTAMTAAAVSNDTDYFKAEVEQEFLDKILIPYRENSCYLKKAAIEEGNTGFIITGELMIPESCYIDDTGHFNAVEYNICFNQLTYVYLGYCIKHQLIPELVNYSEELFFEKQLSNILIANLNSSFQSTINAKHFYGMLGIKSIRKTSKCTFIKTYCYFHDDKNGKSKGEVTLAVLNP